MVQLRTLYRFAFALACSTAFVGCQGEGPPPEPGEGPFCGGIAGFPCPGEGICFDDPSDDCDPEQGGADCGGVCRCIGDRECDDGYVFDDSPEVCDCVVEDPCATVRCRAGYHCEASGGTAECVPDVNPCAAILCIEGSVCEVHDGEGVCVSNGSLPCGSSVCGAGSVCCNSSCGICTPPGRFCIQIACEE